MFKGQHRIRYEFGAELTHWNNGVACGEHDCWDRRVLTQGSAVFEFEHTLADELRLNTILAMLENAFEHGVKTQNKRIHNLLGIKS